MSHLFWNPLSINLLIETIISWLITAFFLQQIISTRRVGKSVHLEILLFIGFSGAAIGVTCQLLSGILPSHIANYPLAWVSPPAALGMAGFVLFSYYFLRPTNTRSITSILLGSTMAVVIAMDLYIAIARQVLLGDGMVEYRDAWLDFPFVLCFLFAYFFFFKSLVLAISKDTGEPVLHSILPAFSAIFWVPTGLSNDAAAARAFFYVTLIPLIQGLTLLARSYSVIDWRLAELLVGWLYLLFLAGFTLVYLNFVPERSSYRVKLVGATLTAVLLILVGVSWIVGPVYVDAYRNGQHLIEGGAYRFEPDVGDSYRARRTAFSFDTDLGQRLEMLKNPVALPFSFRFFGRSYDHLIPTYSGMVGFKDIPLWRDMTHRFGPQPAIFLAATKLARRDEHGPKSGVFVKQSERLVTITWNRLVSSFAPSDYYSFQLKLFASGVIEMAFLELPQKPAYDVYRINTAPVITGIVPDWPNRGVAQINLFSQLPYSSEPGEGLVDVHRQDFVDYLDRIYEPIALFVLAASLFVLMIFPRFFTINLDRPLRNLLGGVQQILNGRLTTSIEVSYRDEIGFLASSFNEMAKAQHELVQTLEDKVAARTAEASLYAEKSARLEERNSLSQELHDAVSQTLFSANLIADTLSEQLKTNPQATSKALEEVRSLNKNALVEMRNLLIELRSKKLTASSFTQLLKDLVAEIEASADLTFHLTLESNPTLPDDIQHTFYRVAQECLSNVVKHAHAKDVSVYFDGMINQAILTFRDDGCGFDLNSKSDTSFGLQIMRERMVKIGGTLEVETKPGHGTRVVAIWMGHDD